MLKKLFLAVLILLAVAGVALLFLGRQAAQLPDWYDPDAEAPGRPEGAQMEGRPEGARMEGRPEGAQVEQSLAEPVTRSGSGSPATAGPAVVSSARDLRRELKQEAARSGTLRLDEEELNALLGRALTSEPDGRRVRDATRAVRATIEGDRLALGAVTDLDRLTAAARDDRERAAIRKLRSLAPWLAGRDFYLGVEGRPQARGGKLTFDGVAVKVGQLSFDPAQLLALVGLPADRLDRELAVRLPDAELEGIRIEGDSLLLSLAAGRSR